MSSSAKRIIAAELGDTGAIKRIATSPDTGSDHALVDVPTLPRRLRDNNEWMQETLLEVWEAVK